MRSGELSNAAAVLPAEGPGSSGASIELSFRIEEASMLHEIDTVIVGGGQAGLAISYYLKQEGREHLVLERAPAIANAWRNQRWDSFTLVTPNFQVRMPGAEYDGNDFYGFMSLREVVQYFDDDVQRYRLPVRCGVEVQGVEKRESVFQVRTTDRDYEAKNAVIAPRLYQPPKIPALRQLFPRTFFSSPKRRPNH